MIRTESHVLIQENWCLVLESIKPSPVIISVPHDGLITGDLGGIFQERKIGHRGRDLHVWPVAKDIIQNLPISAVRGLLPRAFVDYNRSWPEGINYYPLTQKEVHTALDDERLLPDYNHYHSSLATLIENSISNFGKENVLLIDLHGFAKQPSYAPEGGFDLILGTGNRITVPHGDIDQRFAEFMEGLGYSVFLPKPISVGPIEDSYSADFITRHYSERFNINVLQIETASRFRRKTEIEAGKKLSRNISQFLKLNFPLQ